MNHISDKTSILEEILKIENEINRLRKDSTYMKIKNNLKKLERTNIGNRIVYILSPDDLERKIEVRKRSKEMKSIKERFQEQLLGFEEKLGSLRRDRKNLVKQLFG